MAEADTDDPDPGLSREHVADIVNELYNPWGVIESVGTLQIKIILAACAAIDKGDNTRDPVISMASRSSRHGGKS